MNKRFECDAEAQEACEVHRRSRDRWHVGREIPIAVLVMLAIQTGGGIWWLSGVSQKLDSVIAQVAEIKQERYTKDDARRDMDLIRARDGDLERRIANLEQRR